MPSLARFVFLPITRFAEFFHLNLHLHFCFFVPAYVHLPLLLFLLLFTFLLASPTSSPNTDTFHIFLFSWLWPFDRRFAVRSFSSENQRSVNRNRLGSQSTHKWTCGANFYAIC